MQNYIAFTGGGTGGHVYPCLGIIEKLKQKGFHNIVWIGSSSGMERRIVRQWRIPYFGLPSGKLRRYFSLKTFPDFFRILGGILSALILLRRLKPEFLFSKGGYVSVPPVIAAKLLSIPVYTHESDVDPGLATRINAYFADIIFASYEETRNYFSPKVDQKIQVTGVPIRSAVFEGDGDRGRSYLSVSADIPLLLVLGGSQGAEEINYLVLNNLDWLLKRLIVVHQTGERGYRKIERENYFPFAFIGEEYPDLLQAADLVIARSGASTVWEIAAAAKPVLYLPLIGSATRGDQIKNAKQFSKYGAAKVMENNRTPQEFRREIESLLNGDVLRKMAETAKKNTPPDAAHKILQYILQNNRRLK